jgi:iron complex outermembrane receptor protein
MLRKRHVLTPCFVLAALGASAHAQAPLKATAATTLEELVVTAQKREQNLQDVPVAITAFSDKTRDVIGIQSIQDMTNFTPGLQYSTSTDRMTLRGLGRLTNVLSADSSVANYADGIYQTFAVSAGASTLFLDRVEVLRGPQGTLYGRNAIAGAINIISRRPTKDWYAEVRASYGNYDHSDLEFALSGPLGDRVQFRLAGQWENQSEGWIKNTAPGRPSEGNVINTFFLEGQVQVQFSDKFEMWSKLAYSNWQNGSGGPGAQSGGWSPNIYDLAGHVLPDIGPGRPVGGNGYNILEFPDGAGAINEGFRCSGLATNVAGDGATASCVNASHASPWVTHDLTPTRVRLPNSYTLASHWTYHAPGFDLKYVTGGVHYYYVLEQVPGDLKQLTQFTAGATTFFPGNWFNYQEHNGFWSHELNLISTGQGPLQWIAGAYYFKQHYTQPAYVTEDPRQVAWTIAPPFGLCRTGVSPGTGVPAPETGCEPGIGRGFDNRPDMHAVSYALYGQLDYKVTPSLTLTGGLRYSHDRKNGVESVRVLCFGVPACLGGIPPEIFAAPFDLTGAPGVVAGGTGAPFDQLPRGVTGPTSYDQATGFATRHYDASWQALTGTAKVEWRPDGETNLYASYSRGYRSGGLNIGIVTVISAFPWSDKEGVDAFEIGLKKTWGPTLQTNAAAYYYDYDNLQIPIGVMQTAVVNGQTLSQIRGSFYNVPRSHSAGFELEALWQPVERLQVIVSYSFNDAKIERGQALDSGDPTAIQPGAKPIHTVAQCLAGGPAVAGDCIGGDPTLGGFIRIQDLAGNNLPNAPRNKLAVAVDYNWRLKAGSLTATVSYAWRDKTYGRLFTRWYNEAPSWDQWDARALWRDTSDRNEVIAFIKNIANSIGYDQGASGGRISGQFSALYGPNPAGMTCSPVVSGGVVNCLQGMTKTFFPTPPRTYGVEVRHRFF